MADIRIQIQMNPEIHSWIPDHWQRFMLSEHSQLIMAFFTCIYVSMSSVIW